MIHDTYDAKMSAAYGHQSPPLQGHPQAQALEVGVHQRGPLASQIHDPYRQGAPPMGGYAPQSMASQPMAPHAMPPHSISQQSHIHGSYNEPYTHVPVSRAPDGVHVGEGQVGLAPLAPGTQPDPPQPLIHSMTHEGRRYELRCEQQPQRARMCGFGDKDRRPITPPPCVRLIVIDEATGKEADINEIDHGMFVLNVDLWNEHGSGEVNLVRHSATSPCISAANASSYSEMERGNTAYSAILPQQQSAGIKSEPGYQPQQPIYNPYPPSGPPNVNPYAHQQYGQPASVPYGQSTNYGGQGYANGAPQYPPQNGGYSQPGQQPMYYSAGPPMQAGGNPQGMDYPGPATQLPSQPSYGAARQVTNEMDRSMATQRGQSITQGNSPTSPLYTRNLIGSLAASAFRLTDPNERIGIWFVLQDLSVRTEGVFRLRFSFVNIGIPSSPESAVLTVNQGSAPVLASCYSDVFTVYSAKRFPGVVESTNLSKCFATQGIKIPIRKDGQGKGSKDEEYNED